MRQFRAEIDDDLYKEMQVSMAHLEAEANAEGVRMFSDGVEHEN